ncbi:MAG: GIY-YIG nuclease family protein [Chloroflexi bacterium]|nr:GIY-YIG nuclease family protein [Chloroflexota bacterium]
MKTEPNTAGEIWYVYLLECADGTVYTGIATDPERRVRQHNMGRGGHYTRARRPVKLLACRAMPSRASALRLEESIRQLPRARKFALARKWSRGEE